MDKKFIEIDGFKHVLYSTPEVTIDDLVSNTAAHYKLMNQRRSVRHFSDEWIPKEVIENLIKTASTAPSGANKQPWTFCAVSNPQLKQKIRKAAEEEEHLNYSKRMNDKWIKDLKPLGTDSTKEFLTRAPWLIVAFRQVTGSLDNDEVQQHYYTQESIGLACGFLISAIHQAGLVTLTHTPSPLNFLSDVLKRPKNERPFLLLPVGKLQNPCYVPDIKRKPLEQVSEFYE